MRGVWKTQRGMGFSGAILMIALAAFLMTLLFKMGPSYFKYWQVRSAMNELLEQPELVKQGPRGIVTALEKQLYVNEVRSVTGKDFTFKNTKDGRGLEVKVNYIEQQHIGANVDVLMTFDYSVVLPKNPQ